jgi:hypothetical protein
MTVAFCRVGSQPTILLHQHYSIPPVDTVAIIKCKNGESFFLCFSAFRGKLFAVFQDWRSRGFLAR